MVTGANRGIGKETVKSFAKEGAIIYANARTEGCINTLCRELSDSYKTQVMPLYFDVTDLKEMLKAIKQIKSDQGHLDVLVNNAGIMKDAVIGGITSSLMEEVFSVNVFSVINLIQIVAKIMGKEHSGSIINISSIVATQGTAGQIVYSASKGAVISLTKSAAKELARKNIRVNAVAPGMIDTDLFRRLSEKKDISDYLKKIKFRRLGTPEDIANTIVFLASDMSSYITGQTIGIDGGTILD